MKNLEAKRNKLRRDLYDQQDAIDAQRNDLIAEIEGQLKQRHTLLEALEPPLFDVSPAPGASRGGLLDSQIANRV